MGRAHALMWWTSARSGSARLRGLCPGRATFETRMIPTGTKLLDLWHRLAPYPGGPWLFSKIFGFAAPYSGSVRPRIRVLEAGHAEVETPDRRSNRQHLGSVPAIAL